MTTYTVIPSTDRDPESPVTPELIDGLYNNPIAITEGAVGAPRIDSEAAIDWGGGGVGSAASDTYIHASIAGASVGGIGTYIYATASTVDIAAGGTIAGSSLLPTSAIYKHNGGAGDAIQFPTGTALSGTWRCMGTYNDQITVSGTTIYGATLWLRIS